MTDADFTDFFGVPLKKGKRGQKSGDFTLLDTYKKGRKAGMNTGAKGSRNEARSRRLLEAAGYRETA